MSSWISLLLVMLSFVVALPLLFSQCTFPISYWSIFMSLSFSFNPFLLFYVFSFLLIHFVLHFIIIFCIAVQYTTCNLTNYSLKTYTLSADTFDMTFEAGIRCEDCIRSSAAVLCKINIYADISNLIQYFSSTDPDASNNTLFYNTANDPRPVSSWVPF